MDIDPVRLADTESVAQLLARNAGAAPTIEATTDRRRALDGADYAINMIQVGGYRPATVIDFEIPKRYGLRQTIGDTLGIGGIMRALRTIPVMLDIGREMEAALPGRPLPQLHEPDGDAVRRWRGRRRSARSGSATACRGRRPRSPSGSGACRRGRLRLRRDQPHGLLLRLSATGRTSTRRSGSLPPSAAPRPRSGCASRCCAASATSSPSRASTSPSTCRGSSSRAGPT